MRTLLIVLAFAGLVFVEGQAECGDFPCSANDPCDNSAACLGSCECDLETSECLPR